mgnify:CR=1 FL=1
MTKTLNVWDSTIHLRGYNYIQSADYRLYSNSNIGDGYTGAIRCVQRYNEIESSFMTFSETGGTGGASRWTFNKACYVLLTVSQDGMGYAHFPTIIFNGCNSISGNCMGGNFWIAICGWN